MSTLPTKFTTIAGTDAGNKVEAPEEIAKVYKNLEKLSLQGNHWARICVANINSLASGHFKSNVFIESDGYGKFPEYSMILPGLEIHIRKRSNSNYVVFGLRMSSDYQSLQMAGEKPGLFRVKEASPKFEITFVPEGDVLNKENRIVTVADQTLEIQDAAIQANRSANSSPWSPLAKLQGFDMHFTPGTGKIGGRKRIDQAQNPEACPELRESALTLSKTMQGALAVPGVLWVSQGGGSGVLTQAMHILKDQGINFSAAEHRIFFSDLTTNLVKAEGLARDIGMKFDRRTKSINYFSLDSIIGSGRDGGCAAAFYRHRSDPEKYTLLKMSVDIGKEFHAAKGAITTLGVTSMAVGSALGFSPAALALPAGITAAVALGGKVFSIGSTLTRQYAPNVYDKIARKF